MLRAADGKFAFVLSGNNLASVQVQNISAGSYSIPSGAPAPGNAQFTFGLGVPGPNAQPGDVGWPMVVGYGADYADDRGTCTMVLSESGNGPMNGKIDCPNLYGGLVAGDTDGAAYSLDATFTLTP